MENFADRLICAIEKKQNSSVVGLDPRLEQIPSYIQEKNIKKFGKNFKAAGEAILEFNKGIIDAVYEIVPAVKPQIAFYEQYGPEGIQAFIETVNYAKDKGLVTIEDGKRNDIKSTAAAYGNAHIGKVDVFGQEKPCFDVDAITVNAYLGIDGVQPFLENVKKYQKGIFVLVKTSNPSSGELQDLQSENQTIYEIMAELCNKWGENTEGKRGYSPVGAVVGATYPKQAETLRKIMPSCIFLVPGYGAQGGGADDVIPCFNKDGYGAIVNSSRGIIFAFKKDEKYTEKDFVEAAHQAALKMKEDITSSMKKNNIYPW